MAEEEAKPTEENAEATAPAVAGAEAAAEAPVEAAPPPNMMVPMIASVIISLGGMFAIFQFVIGPSIKASISKAVKDANSTDSNKTAKADAKAEPKDDSKKGEASGGDGKDESAGPIPIVGEDENIIVNPAGSGGTRYLLVEIFLVRKYDNDTGFKSAIEAKSKELQDKTINTLRRFNAEDLSDPVIQDTIKNRLKGQYQAIIGEDLEIDRLVVPKWIMQ
jgi:flagellar FliL protein